MPAMLLAFAGIYHGLGGAGPASEGQCGGKPSLAWEACVRRIQGAACLVRAVNSNAGQSAELRRLAPEGSQKRSAAPPDEKLNLLEREAWAQTSRLAQRGDGLVLAAKAGRGERQHDACDIELRSNTFFFFFFFYLVQFVYCS